MATNEDGAESGGADVCPVCGMTDCELRANAPPAPQRPTDAASDGQRLAEIAAREAGATLLELFHSKEQRMCENGSGLTHNGMIGATVALHWAQEKFDALAARLAAAESNLAEHERLKHELSAMLHPNGDGPPNPSWCDLIAFIGNDLANAGRLLVAAESARREAEGERHAADQRAEARYLDLSAENAAMRDALKLAEVPLRSAVSQSGHTLGCRCVDHWCALRERAMNAVAAALAPPAAPATETGTGTQQASAGEPERACHD
jgi:hypothetical protein